MDQTFHAIIEVVNRASAPLHKIEADFYGLIAPIVAVGAAVSALAEETGIVALGEQATVAMEKVGALGRELGALLGPIALIGGVASAGGLLEISKKASEFGEDLLHSSEKTGIDVPVIARLHYVAKMENIDPELFDKAMGRLNASMFEAMHGKNKNLDAILSHTEGVNWSKHVKNAEDGLVLVANAWQKLNGRPLAQGELEKNAFGGRSGFNLAPILSKTTAEYKAAGDQFERFNGVWSKSRALDSKASAEGWKQLSAAMEGLSNTIGTQIAPSMLKMIEPLTDWIAKNRELIGIKVDHFVDEVGTALKNVDWHEIGEGIHDVWDAFKGLGDVLGARGVVFLGAAVIFGPIAKSAIEAGYAVAKLAVDFGVAAVKLGAILGLQVAGFFTDLVTGIHLAIPAMDALDLAMDANPIGVAVMALTGLAAAAYEIYEHWAPISGFFSGIWQSIKTTMAPVGQWFSDLWNGITIEFRGAMKWIHDALEPVGKFFHEVWEDIAKIVNAVWDKIGPIFNKVGSFLSTLSGLIGHAVVATALTMPGAAGAIEIAHGVEHIHDIGEQDRKDRAGLESHFIKPGTLRNTPNFSTRAALVDPARRAAIQAGGAAMRAEADVNVNFNNLPRGTQTSVQTRGGDLNVKVGKSFANE